MQILEPRQSFAKMQVGVMACLSPRECEGTPDLQHKESPEKGFLKGQAKSHIKQSLLFSKAKQIKSQ